MCNSKFTVFNRALVISIGARTPAHVLQARRTRMLLDNNKKWG